MLNSPRCYLYPHDHNSPRFHHAHTSRINPCLPSHLTWFICFICYMRVFKLIAWTVGFIYSVLAVVTAACLCVNNWLGGCILNIPRARRSSYRCLGSLQTCSVSPFIRMKRLPHGLRPAGTMKRPPLPWSWTPSSTWMFWCLSFQTRCSPRWPPTSRRPGTIHGRLVRKWSDDF